MTVPAERIAENLKRVVDRIAQACARAGRSAQAVRLVAVTKSVGLDEIRSLPALGQLDLAENRPQQFAERVERTTALSTTASAVRWHFIGHLQRNKVKLVVPAAYLIHSVDSLRLAEEIARRAGQCPGAPPARMLLEVNVSGEEAKDGVPIREAEAIALQVVAMPNLRLCGLMTMAPRTDSPEQARPVFAGLRGLFERLRSAHGARPEFAEFTELSMGMSGDFESAVEEGATLVRIGSALFE